MAQAKRRVGRPKVSTAKPEPSQETSSIRATGDTPEVPAKRGRGRPKGYKNTKSTWANVPKPRFDPRKFFSCLKCEGIFKNIERIGHCPEPECCLTFSGAAFDAHRKFPHQVDENGQVIPGRRKMEGEQDNIISDVKKVCINPAIQDKSQKWRFEADEPGGVWHKGDKADPAVFKKLAANDKARKEAAAQANAEDDTKTQ